MGNRANDEFSVGEDDLLHTTICLNGLRKIKKNIPIWIDNTFG
jgi:hypothetical protein